MTSIANKLAIKLVAGKSVNESQGINGKRKTISPDANINVAKCIKITDNAHLDQSFYNKPCLKLAEELLGKILVRSFDNGTRASGRIVEVEGYIGGIDKASHSFNGRKTERTAAMYMDPGTAYVYIIYGMYNCFNISSEEPGAAVLIRSLEPIEGISVMLENRSVGRKAPKKLKERDLCNGPSKLCQALQIDKNTFNSMNLVTSKSLWIENDPLFKLGPIVKSKRIGIESAGEEWSNKLFRYYHISKFVSVRDKEAEKNIVITDDTQD